MDLTKHMFKIVRVTTIFGGIPKLGIITPIVNKTGEVIKERVNIFYLDGSSRSYKTTVIEKVSEVELTDTDMKSKCDVLISTLKEVSQYINLDAETDINNLSYEVTLNLAMTTMSEYYLASTRKYRKSTQYLKDLNTYLQDTLNRDMTQPYVLLNVAYISDEISKVSRCVFEEMVLK